MKKIIIILFILFNFLYLSSNINLPLFANPTIRNETSHKQLTIEEAKELLLKYNNKVDYIYQGEANEFKALKDKNLHGYVFLPNVETDIGYFVDKNTCSIYFFHPSGYLQLVKELPN